MGAAGRAKVSGGAGSAPVPIPMGESSAHLLTAFAAEALQAEGVRAFEAAWEWAAPQARSEEERRLLAATLLVLHGVQAVVVPRRLAPEALASLHVTGTRRTPEGPSRRHLFVLVTPDGALPPEADAESLCFSAEDARETPLLCAGRILGELLTRLLDGG